MLITDITNYITTPIKGVIHVGAHHGEEKKWYNTNNIKNILWIEGNPNLFTNLKKVVGDDKIIIEVIGIKQDKTQFNISNNGQSSSLLNLGLHKKHHPDIVYTESIEVNVKTLSQIIEEYKIKIENYNFINLDIQGTELDALISLGDYIKNIDYIYTEVNTNYVYENCALISEIDEYLSHHSFKRVETHITPWEWGDALYIKK